MPAPLLTTDQVARRLNLSTWTIRNLVHEGRLPVVRLCERKFLFQESEIERVVEEAQTPIAGERA